MPGPMQFDSRFTLDDRAFTRAVRGAIARGRDERPALEAIGELGRTSIAQNFAEQGRPDAWKPLSAATLYERIGGSRGLTKGAPGRPGTRRLTKRAERGLAGMKILIRTGRLLRSIAWKIVGHGVDIGTNLIYARILSLGGMAGRGRKVKIPARPYAMWQESDKREIRRILTEHFLGKGLFDLGGIRL